MAVKARQQNRFSTRFETAKKYFSPDGPKYNVKALCEALTITRKEFQEYTGVAANNYWEDKLFGFNKDALEDKVAKLLLLQLLLEDLFPNKMDAQFWLRLPSTEFANRSPLKAAVDGKIDEVLSALSILADGNTVA